MRKILLLALIGLGAKLYAADTPKTGEPIGLRCEHLVNPLGIDKQHPRLQWMLWDKRQGAKQSAYQIQVGTDSLSVLGSQGNIWDSGKVEQANMLVTYAGKPLDPQTRYFWKVTTWDKDGQEHASSIAAFETGIMHANQWKGTWISDNNDINHLQAPYFRKQFQVKKEIK